MRTVSVKTTTSEASTAWEPTTDACRSTPDNSSSPTIVADANDERAFVELLERPIDASDGHRIGTVCRERELNILIAMFTPITALALQRRLDREAADDQLVRAFRRLTPERRNRLYARLAANRHRKRVG